MGDIQLDLIEQPNEGDAVPDHECYFLLMKDEKQICRARCLNPPFTILHVTGGVFRGGRSVEGEAAIAGKYFDPVYDLSSSVVAVSSTLRSLSNLNLALVCVSSGKKQTFDMSTTI